MPLKITETFWTYDPEIKRQSTHWKGPHSRIATKTRMITSKSLCSWKSTYWITLLLWGSCSTSWKNYKSWVLYHNDTPGHTVWQDVSSQVSHRVIPHCLEKTFLAKYNKIPVSDHAPYSPYSLDLAPCDLHKFPKVKTALKGTRCQTVEAVEERVEKKISTTVSNQGKFVRSVVGIEEGCMLKVTITKYV